MLKMNFVRFLSLFSLLLCVNCDKTLKQVVILSRHNLRTPLSKTLVSVTPKPWPPWKEKPGFLTQKGKKLEGYMGAYFSAWLKHLQLLPDSCPDKYDIYVYANIKQRTKASAQAFVDKAFPNCNVVVHHNDSNKMDPIFNPVIHNTTTDFKQTALEQMEAVLKSLQLNESYENVNKILDYEDSEMCKMEKKCSLTTDMNKIINIEAGLKPNIKGPLKIGNSAIDAFKMEYYEGFPAAWGSLSHFNDWSQIVSISRGYHNVIFNTTAIAMDISMPLLNYMSEIFLNDTQLPKVTLLMGHDANLYTVLKGMGFKYYVLKKQFDNAPVGGKIVFQKWFDDCDGLYYLKIGYVYQSSEQLRNDIELSLSNPPLFTTLELVKCKIDKDGYCPWDRFVKLLKSLTS